MAAAAPAVPGRAAAIRQGAHASMVTIRDTLPPLKEHMEAAAALIQRNFPVPLLQAAGATELNE